jgi:hypothetical protein
MVNIILEWFRTLFSHRRLLRERDAEIFEAKLQIAELVARLAAYEVPPSPKPAIEEPEESMKPILLRRNVFLRYQAQFEFDHNSKLKDAVLKAKLGML